MGEKKNTPMTIAKAAQQANYRQQDRFAERILRYFKSRIEQITLGVWGLAFKPNTEDIRRSPAIRCIEKFIDAGIKIKAYDPKAMSKTKDRLDGRICTTPGSYDVLDNADALVIFTDWQEFRTPDFEQIVSRLNSPVIFDGRNLYDPVYVKKQGIE